MTAAPAGGGAPAPPVRTPACVWRPSPPLAPDAVWSPLASVKPADSPLVTESTSTMAQQLHWIPTTRPASFFATASGGIRRGLPPPGGPGPGGPRRAGQGTGGGAPGARPRPGPGPGEVHGAQP